MVWQKLTKILEEDRGVVKSKAGREYEVHSSEINLKKKEIVEALENGEEVWLKIDFLRDPYRKGRRNAEVFDIKIGAW